MFRQGPKNNDRKQNTMLCKCKPDLFIRSISFPVFLSPRWSRNSATASAWGHALHGSTNVYSKRSSSGAQRVQGWFWMPEDRPEQRVLDFQVVEGPASLRITRDPCYGRNWLYAEAAADPQKPLRIVTEFKVVRRPVKGMADPEKTGPITDRHRRAFAPELRRDELHMEVTPQIQKIADELAGKETNPVLQARKFFDYVIEKSDHYSKFGKTPKGKCLGDAMECLAGSGDCCTDQHALFIALCRAREIPCRLMYGSRLKPENQGKDHDPGYRCWLNFFAPGLGWVPLDVSSGDTGGERASEWFGGLDDQRLEWAEGRDFDLHPRSAVRPDLVIRGWVEVDGKPHKGLDRIVNFQSQELPSSQKSNLAAREPGPK
jgi:transglutaminase-like putative cysteine protease